jgi:Dioxygenase
MIEAPGFHKLVTSLYPEGDVFLSSDAVFGVKKSLVVVSETQTLLRPVCLFYFAS